MFQEEGKMLIFCKSFEGRLGVGALQDLKVSVLAAQAQQGRLCYLY